jgi:hypothetical protein
MKDAYIISFLGASTACVLVKQFKQPADQSGHATTVKNKVSTSEIHTTNKLQRQHNHQWEQFSKLNPLL